MSNGDVLISRPLSISENFFRSRTASGHYRSFAVSSTYNQNLNNLSLFYKALRKTILEYHILICNVQFKGQYVYQPLENIKLENILQFNTDVQYLRNGVVTESFMKKVNEITFNLYTQDPLFKLVLVGDYNLVCIFEHTIADGVVGNYFHEIFLQNLAYCDDTNNDVFAVSFGDVPEEISLDTTIFNFSKDLKFIKNSLPPPLDLFMEDIDLDYTYNNPDFFERVIPQCYKRWNGRFDAINTHEISFKVINFNLEETKQILNACKKHNVTLTSYIVVIEALTLQPIFGDNYTVHKVAMALRRHIQKDKAPIEYQQILSDPNYKILGTSAHMGFGNNIPPLKKFSWNAVKEVNDNILQSTKNKRALNQMKGWKDKGDLLDPTNQSFFDSQLNKPKADHVKFSNLGLIKLPEYKVKDKKIWKIENMIFWQDMAPYSAEFMLSAVSTPLGGLNFVLSYYDYTFDDIPGDNFDKYIIQLHDNMLNCAS
ncbi:unnamed protein product [Candida verbasci]|uniref:Alcohol acetyltransferase n=1 Tax=Candida verbasci TaxID=1227364 RepID=A0A9W4TYX4_9ASCO|nr:unnamed protein product [Candida verbasci]